LAAGLAATPVRPVHLTACGLAAAAGAGAVLVWRPQAMPLAALLVLVYWFFDRADGQLARRQQTVSAWGAWLDANVDELVDVALHVAIAAVLAAQIAAIWPWWLLAAFLAGKYLLIYGLAVEEHAVAETGLSAEKPSPAGGRRERVAGVERSEPPGPLPSGGSLALAPGHPDTGRRRESTGWLRRAYHLPGNADVRAHLLVVALATGYLAVELAWVAAYYNLRWLLRYVLVARRAPTEGWSGGVR
jgi:phosphatidylglycerophosphate synthase